jgi:hypothetical protein
MRWLTPSRHSTEPPGWDAPKPSTAWHLPNPNVSHPTRFHSITIPDAGSNHQGGIRCRRLFRDLCTTTTRRVCVGQFRVQHSSHEPGRLHFFLFLWQPLRAHSDCPATCLLVEGSIGQASRSIEPTSMRASHVPVSTNSQCNQARGRGRKGRIEGVVRILPRPPRIEHRHQRMRKPCRCCRLAEQFDSSSRMHPEPRIRFQRRRQLGQLERHRRRRVAATTWHASRAGCRQSKIPNHCICLALGLTDHAQHTGRRHTANLPTWPPHDAGNMHDSNTRSALRRYSHRLTFVSRLSLNKRIPSSVTRHLSRAGFLFRLTYPALPARALVGISALLPMAVVGDSEPGAQGPRPHHASPPIFGAVSLASPSQARASLEQGFFASAHLVLTRFLPCPLAEERAIDPQTRGFSLIDTSFPG